MTTTFPNLFSSFQIGNVTVKNRIVSTGHDTTMAVDGLVSEKLIAYQEARAKGGAGLIVAQVTGVHESARYTNHVLIGTEDKCIAGFRELAEKVHSHGAKIFVQLFHPGREMLESLDGSTQVAYAPSSSPSERFHVIPHAISVELIKEIVQGYGDTAARLEKAGVDGVEIVASHSYLPSQFLNPFVNRREDDYGGSPEKRLRFVEDAIESARARTSNDFVVGLRISGDDKYDGGLDEQTSLGICKALAEKIDYVSVVAGSSATLGGAIHIAPSMYFDNGYVAPFSAAVKAQISVPVIVTGRINQPQVAEQILRSNQADFCGMTRAMICDPKMPEKAEKGLVDDIRACIGCNQACMGHFHIGHSISCIQYPESGRELQYGSIKPTDSPKNIMVIGGGPAGMKAAATAATRGHDVTLYEAQDSLGGQVRLAQLVPHRIEFGGIITNLSRELELAGVTVQLNTKVTPELIATEEPDVIIVATGSHPRWPDPFEYGGDGQVVQACDVLKNEVKVGQSVVIADWKSDWVGMGVAELLAEAGCRVRLAVNGLHAGATIQSYIRDSGIGRLHNFGVEIIPCSRLYGRDEDSVYLQHTITGEPVILSDVDTLVLAQGNTPDTSMQDQLIGFSGGLISIGDCVMARTCEEAVLEGLRAAWEIK
jgi:2,4-dienoyl-CoA reductase-like NADH-dependent reductase (Old Yellow Enzyme family)/thioredoxin reductase